jgi:hypothetical protein
LFVDLPRLTVDMLLFIDHGGAQHSKRRKHVAGVQ